MKPRSRPFDWKAHGSIVQEMTWPGLWLGPEEFSIDATQPLTEAEAIAKGVFIKVDAVDDIEKYVTHGVTVIPIRSVRPKQ